MKPRRLAPAVLVLLAVAACSARPDVLAVEGPRPARAPADVALLLDPPERPFRTLALIRSSNRNFFNDVDALKEDVRQAAAELGADAVILSLSSHDGGGDATAVGTDGSVVVVGGSSNELRVVGRAIVYTDG